MVDQFSKLLKTTQQQQTLLLEADQQRLIESAELASLFKLLSGKEKWMKRGEYQKFLSSLNLIPVRMLKPHMPTLEKYAQHLISQKNDLYFLDLISLMRPFLTLTSQDFLSFLLATIDQRILLLHRNLPGLLTVLETLEMLGVTDPILYRSIEQFVTT